MELEQKSESNQQNYWMIQYQRLLDAKPLSLRMQVRAALLQALRSCVQISKSLTLCCPFLSPQEAAVDRDLGNMLCKLSAQHYLPIIAHHRITAEALRHMTAKDLRKVCYLSLYVSIHFWKCVCLGICHQRSMSIKMIFHYFFFWVFFTVGDQWGWRAESSSPLGQRTHSVWP